MVLWCPRDRAKLGAGGEAELLRFGVVAPAPEPGWAGRGPGAPRCPRTAAGGSGGPHPERQGAVCYSAQLRRRLMKPVPGELPHSSGSQLINEASATAAAASARGTGTGTGGRTHGRTGGCADGEKRLCPSWRSWSWAGQLRERMWRGQRDPRTTGPPRCCPCPLAEGTGGAAVSPRGRGRAALAGPNFPPKPRAACIDFICGFHGNCLLPFPLPAAGPAPSPSGSGHPAPGTREGTQEGTLAIPAVTTPPAQPCA